MSLTEANLKTLKSANVTSVKSEYDSKSVQSSLRSLKVSQQDGYYSQKGTQQLGEQAKKNIQKSFELLNKGKISKEAFAKTVKQDLGLQTNDYFDKAIGKIEVNFAEVVKGIQKNHRDENQNLKPNTYDPVIISGYDKTISIGKFQEKFLPVANFQQNDEFQKKILDEVSKLRAGITPPIQFKKTLESQGLYTDLIDRELRELNSSNTGSYTRISSGIFRALEEQRSRQQNASLIGLNDNPIRGDPECNKQAQLQRVNFDMPTSGEDKENNALEKQLRTFTNGNVYNEMRRPAPEDNLASKHNGDILTWNNSDGKEIPLFERVHKHANPKFNQSTFKLQDLQPSQPEQQKDIAAAPASANKKKNLQQMKSTFNIISYESQPFASPKKAIDVNHGAGNIITWKKQ